MNPGSSRIRVQTDAAPAQPFVSRKNPAIATTHCKGVNKCRVGWVGDKNLCARRTGLYPRIYHAAASPRPAVLAFPSLNTQLGEGWHGCTTRLPPGARRTIKPLPKHVRRLPLRPSCGRPVHRTDCRAAATRNIYPRPRTTIRQCNAVAALNGDRNAPLKWADGITSAQSSEVSSVRALSCFFKALGATTTGRKEALA